MPILNLEEQISQCLQNARTVAVVGFSANPDRPSHQVAIYLQQQGYRIIPVNPGLSGQTHLGERCYPSLQDAVQQHQIDIADCFRRSEEMPRVVEDAIAAGTSYIWMQSGITHKEAAKQAQAAGIVVIQDRCLKIEHLHRRQILSTGRAK